MAVRPATPSLLRDKTSRIAGAEGSRTKGGLRLQKQRGLIALDDVDEAAGMLLGMLTSAPRRAAMFGGLPLPSRLEIEARVRRCAALFLRGCQVAKRNSRLLK